jgi:NAD(P)-dependent dehydrogenase (short-subunit alcohol dehydrogenase family)
VRIEENTFLVAGGGSGLGDATAHMLAASGARVVVADLKGEAPKGGRFVETDEGGVRAEEYADLVKHIIENEILNGEVIRLDGGFSGLTTIRMALMLPSATSRVTTLWGLPSPK